MEEEIDIDEVLQLEFSKEELILIINALESVPYNIYNFLNYRIIVDKLRIML